MKAIREKTDRPLLFGLKKFVKHNTIRVLKTTENKI